MTTDAKKTLDDFDELFHDFGPEERDTIRRALLVLNLIESVYSQYPDSITADTKHIRGADLYREHLKKIRSGPE